MKHKFVDWCSTHRKNIAYTLAGLNLVSGFSLIGSGQYINGYLQLFIGAVILIDAVTTR